MLKRALSLILLASLAGCAGGHVTSAVPHTAAVNAPSSGARATTSFVVTIPRATATSAQRRAPRYISPATGSLGITIDPGSPNQGFAAMNIGPGDPNCNTPTPVSPLQCTVTVSVLPGSHTFDFRTYDGRLDTNGNPQGSVLSTNLGFPFNVVPGQNNSLHFVLQGIPAGVSVLAQPNQDVRGDQTGGFDLYGAYKADGTTIFPRVVTVVATDADGNFIVGAGAPALTLTSSNHAQLSDGVVSGSNANQFTLTPAGASSGSIQLTATATPSTGAQTNSGASPVTALVSVRYAARNAPRIYLSGGPAHNWVKVYDEFGNAVSVSGTFPGVNGPDGLGYDATNGRIFAANFSNGTVTAYDADGNAATLSTPITGLINPMSVAWDPGRNRIYVATHDKGLFAYDPSGNPIATRGNWFVPAPRGNGTVFPYDPTALLIDPRAGTHGGNIYANDVANGGSVAVYDGDGNGVWSFGSDNGTAGLAEDPVSGHLFASWTAHAVTVFDESGTIISIPGTWPHTAQPNAIVYNPANGRVYVYDTDPAASGYTQNVTVYDVNGNAIATPATFAGAENGWGMTLVP